MHPMVARAFLNGLLTSEQRLRLRQYENTLEPGRYLQGFEICNLFKLKPNPVDEKETDRIQSLYFEYRKRIEWKQSQLNDIHHEEVCNKKPRRNIGKYGWCYCPTTQQDVHAWEDWSLEHMDKTLEELAWA